MDVVKKSGLYDEEKIWTEWEESGLYEENMDWVKSGPCEEIWTEWEESRLCKENMDGVRRSGLYEEYGLIKKEVD
jgi:hypothetical protein